MPFCFFPNIVFLSFISVDACSYGLLILLHNVSLRGKTTLYASMYPCTFRFPLFCFYKCFCEQPCTRLCAYKQSFWGEEYVLMCQH